MQILTRQSARERFTAFMASWKAAPSDTDIEIRKGKSSEGVPSLLISVGKEDYPFLAPELDVVISILEDSAKKFPGTFEDEGLDGLLRGIKTAMEPSP